MRSNICLTIGWGSLISIRMFVFVVMDLSSGRPVGAGAADGMNPV